jgi:hypothetical protein
VVNRLSTTSAMPPALNAHLLSVPFWRFPPTSGNIVVNVYLSKRNQSLPGRMRTDHSTSKSEPLLPPQNDILIKAMGDFHEASPTM